MKLVPILVITLLLGCASRQGVSVKEQSKPTKHYRYLGGEGDSYETAVIIEGAKDHRHEVEAEYAFISQKHGEQGKDWEVTAQSLTKEEGKSYDMVEIKILSTGEPRFYYFDVSKNTYSSE